MKILNLYAGIGGNRRLWPAGNEITAVEYNPDIAAIYKDFFPDDNVIVGDAHQYLLDHYKEYDFIWASPPCPTHSDIRRCGVHKGQYPALYPDMTLYQEIILLMNFAPKTCKWVIENVKPYYDLLIPGQIAGRHVYWSNFYINADKIKDSRIHSDILGTSTIYGFNIKKYKADNKRKILRNMVNPELGLYVYNAAFKNVQMDLLA